LPLTDAVTALVARTGAAGIVDEPHSLSRIGDDRPAMLKMPDARGG
jgi:hypothetical protein